MAACDWSNLDEELGWVVESANRLTWRFTANNESSSVMERTSDSVRVRVRVSLLPCVPKSFYSRQSVGYRIAYRIADIKSTDDGKDL